MTIDARAYVWCSLGPLSEEGSSIAEDHAQGTGVIMYKGTINLKGVIQLSPGTVVHLAYSDGQNWIARLPIRLRVISHFCNPITDRTSVSVGCDFAYKENREPKIDPITAEEANPDADPEDWKAAPPAISAKYIADMVTCVLRLKGAGTILGITNVARASGIVTITTDSPHGLVKGDSASVAADTNIAVGGNYDVEEASGTTFSYVLSGLPIPSAADTGTVITVKRPPLNNKFAKQEFDFSKGLINTFGDLMKSEGYVARMNEAGGVEYIPKNPGIGAGPVITEDDLIDFNPINTGDLPADEVAAKHESEKLKPPAENETSGDPQGETPEEKQERIDKEREKRNWEREESYGPLEEYKHVWNYYVVTPTGGQKKVKDSRCHTVYDNNTNQPKEQPANEVKSFEREERESFIPYSVTKTNYDKKDRAISRITDKNSVWGVEHTETWFKYEDSDETSTAEVVPFTCTLPGLPGDNPDNAPGQTFEDQRPKKEADKGALISERTVTWSPIGPLRLSLGLNRPFRTVRGSGGGQYVSSVREVYYTKDEESGITKTVTMGWEPYINTPSGSEIISRERDRRNPWEDVDTDSAEALRYTGAEVRIRTEREFGIEKRPGVVDRNVDGNRKTPKTEQEEKVVFEYKSSSSQNKLELSPPYVPDDTIEKDENGNYVVKKSDADKKAREYAQTENKLLHGHRHGAGIQILPELLPSRPLQTFFIRIKGCTGAYLTNGRTWNFDPSGMTLTCDASFIGAIDGTITNAWYPLPPNATSLPAPVSTTTNANPKPANAISIPTGFNFGSPDLTALFGSLPAGVAPVYPRTISPSNLVKPYRITIFCGAGSGSGAIADPQFWIAQPAGEYLAGSGSGVLATAVAGPSTSLGARWTSGTTFTAAAGTAGPGHGGGERWASGSVFTAGVGSDGLVRAPGARWTSATAFTAGAAESGLVLGAGARWTSSSTFTAGAGSDDLEQAPGATWTSASVFLAGAGDDGIEQGAGATWTSASTFLAGAANDGLEEAPGANWSSGSAFYAGVGGVGDGAGAGAAWTSGSTFVAGAGALTEPGDRRFASVSLLLHFDGANGSTTFTDSSSNSVALTRVGSGTISTAQAKFGQSYLNTSVGDRLVIPASSLFTFAGDFTVEVWCYQTNRFNYDTLLELGSYDNGIMIRNGPSGASIYVNNQNIPYNFGNLNEWIHIAVVRVGTIVTAYANGVSVGTANVTGTVNSTGSQGFIGDSTHFPNRPFYGYIDELRISKVARYQSNFTPPTAPFPNIASTTVAWTSGSVFTAGAGSSADPTDPYFSSVSLLLPFNGANGSTTFTDQSLSARTPTSVVSTSITTAQSKFGGSSVAFNGNGYISYAPAAALQFDGDFTLEGWFYLDSNADMIFGSSSSDQNTQVFRFNNGQLSFYLNGTSVVGVSSGMQPATWYHVAFTRAGADTKVFVDGIQKGSTATYSGTFRMDFMGALNFNYGSSIFQFFSGKVNQFRATKGIARYTANFTPPTAPFPNSGPPDPHFANVSLLLHMDGANNSTSFIDSSSFNRTLTAAGNAKISTTQSKFGGASAAFDGSGDFASTGSYAFAGSGDFTIELWVYINSLASKTAYIDVENLIIYTDASDATLRVYHGSALLGGGSLSTAQWMHIAVTRQGTTGRLFINGVQVSINNSYSTAISSGITHLGCEDGNSNFLNGFIDEVRLTAGVARYTENFTPPTAPFPNS